MQNFNEILTIRIVANSPDLIQRSPKNNEKRKGPKKKIIKKKIIERDNNKRKTFIMYALILNESLFSAIAILDNIT